MTGRPFRFRTTRPCLLSSLALLVLACRAGPEPPRDLLLVSLDTIRADRVGSYGRADAGTPVLDALAARGARFDDATSASPLTLPSHATLLTGTDPLRHRIRHNGLFALPPGAETLAERLAGAGFRTGAFVASVVLAERHGLAQGFEAYTAPERRSGAGVFFLGERPAQAVNRDALAWLDSIGDQRFFLWVHYMEPHAPFQPPEPERSRYPDDPYQGEIAAADRALGELLAGLEARGRLARTLVVVAGDHGESLGDHGELSHGVLLYQPTLRVPLVVAGPGVAAGRAIREPVGLVDVAPTLLAAAGLDGAGLDGASLWPALGGEAAPADRALYAESFVARLDYGWSELRALRRGPYKYVQAPRPELYRPDRDPEEAQNLLGAEPERARSLARELAARVAAGEARAGAPERLEPSPGTRAALERLGYLSGAHEGDPEAGGLDPKDQIDLVSAMEWASQRVHEGRYADAEGVLRELVSRAPRSVEIRLRLVTVLLLQERPAQAAEEARRLVEVAAELPHGARVAARAHVVLGELAAAEGRLDAAAAHYEQALAAPLPGRVHVELARVYAALGRRQAALELLDRLEARGEAAEDSRALRRELETSAGSAAAAGKR